MHKKINQEYLESIVEDVLEQASNQGADQVEVTATKDMGFGVTARMGDIENIEYTNGSGLTITVYINSKKGTASTSDLNASALKETIRKACSFAKYTAADNCSGLADASLMALGTLPDIDIQHNWSISVEEATKIAIECEGAALNLDAKIVNSEGGNVNTNTAIRVYGNSHGFLRSYQKTNHSIGCVVVAGQENEKQRDYWYSSSRHPDDLEDHTQIGKKAGMRTLSRLGSKKIDTTEAPVLFSPELAGGFIGHAISALSGSAQYRKTSFLLGAVGKQIFPDFFSIQERPHILKGMASRVFDAEGVATQDRNIVLNGIIEGYLLSAYSARRLNMSTTANAGGYHNLIIPGNADNQKAIISSMQRGLLVQELIGQGVNNVTGDYSRGAAGYWIENGVIVHPVHEVTISGNLIDLYKNILMIGHDYDERSGIRCGALLIDKLRISGN